MIKQLHISCVLLICSINLWAQTADLSGSILNALDNTPVSNVTFQVFYHNLSFTENGYPIIGKKDKKLFITSIETNNTGAFKLTIPVRFDSIDYVYISVSKPNFTPLTKNHIKLTPNVTELISLELKLTNLSPEETQLLEAKAESTFIAKEQAKLQQLIADEAIPLKKKSPNHSKVIAIITSFIGFIVYLWSTQKRFRK